MQQQSVTLGRHPSATDKRDAIHFAVIPIQAQIRLQPGDRVDASGRQADKPVGIVDPFLPHHVEEGEWFWLVLFPGTVQSIRHEWDHPAFANKSTSMQCIAKIAAQCGYTPERMIEIGKEYMWYDEPFMDNSEQYKDVPCEHWDEFWYHFAAVTGMDISPDAGAPFSCAC